MPSKVYKFHVEMPDGSVHLGIEYEFDANLTDVATIPQMPWTSILVDRVKAHKCPPWTWRNNSSEVARIVEVEDMSDAGTKTLKQEAQDAWSSLAGFIGKKIHWMHFLGLHDDILRRVEEPLLVRRVKVRTLIDDVLPRLYACGSAEIIRIAQVLHGKEVKSSDEFRPRIKLESFLWPDTGIPEERSTRYAQAVAEGFQAFDSKFSPPSLMPAV